MTGLRALIQDGVVHVLDGAMGTLLYERGVFVNVCYDELSLTRPELVEGIHREYVEAGAEILETNTFGANPVKLSGFALDEKTEEINRAAAGLARMAAGDGVVVIGAIGPLGLRIEPWGPTSAEEAEDYFRRQAQGLVEGQVDGFLLETFSDLNELRQALRAVRSIGDLPVFAQVAFEEGGNTSYGTNAETVARTLDEWGVDVIGVNCSVGPSETLDVVERMAGVTEVPLAAQPNAGLPRLVGDRKMYLASPSYMARYAARMVEAGTRFVGGCCGTTPAHIRELQVAVSASGEDPRKRAGAGSKAFVSVRAPSGRAFGADLAVPGARGTAVPLGERSRLGQKLASGDFVTSFELLPPSGWDPEPLVAQARRALEAGADVVTLTDSSTGRRRMGAIPAGILLARDLDAEVVVRYTCRDRNMLRMISDFLGAAAAGIRNVLVVSGDPTSTGPYPDHTAVFDIDSIGLTNLLDHLNHGVDPGGQEVDPPTCFVVGVVLNQGTADLAREERRYRWKLKAGADFVVTQPVFDPAVLTAFLDRAASVRQVPVLATVSPLGSLRDAEYLAQEVPGTQMPRTLLERMGVAEARGPDTAKDEGLKIAREIVAAVRPRVQGVHVTQSRAGVDQSLDFLREVSGREESPPVVR